MSSKYSPTVIGQVRKWYLEEGKSDAAIAGLLNRTVPGGVTRNAVIGLRQRANPPILRESVHRPTMARPARPASSRETKPAPPPQRQAPPPIQRPAPPPPVQPVAAPYRTKADLLAMTGPTILHIGANQCRNPVGPDATPTAPQMFCGAPVGTREVEIRKGVYQTKIDTYCASCARRNRVGTSPASSLIRSTRAYS